MEEFLEQVPLLLGVLGHRVLDPLTRASPTSGAQLTFIYTVKGAKAVGTVTDEGFVVFEGSKALNGITETMTPGYVAFKKELIASGKLADTGALLLFTEDVLFDSPSAAAGVVYGNNVNGREAWKAEDGRTVKNIEESEAS